MAVLGFLFFTSVLGIAVSSIVLTLRPRMGYIVELLLGHATQSAQIPVAARRRVRRLTPLSVRSELRMIRAAA